MNSDKTLWPDSLFYLIWEDDRKRHLNTIYREKRQKR